MSKEGRFIEYLTFLKGEKLTERIVKIVNRFQKMDQEVEAKEKIGAREHEELMRVICRLPEDPASFFLQGGLKTIRSDGAYGKRIKQLADVLMGSAVI